MFVFAVVAALAAQEPPQPPPIEAPARIHEVVYRTTRYADDKNDRAESVCRCSQYRCECDLNALKEFDVDLTTLIDRPAVVSGKVLPIFDKTDGRRCVVAFDVALTSDVDDLTIEWSRASILADNVARPAVPGFARRANANLVQRPSIAPRGSLLHEQVFSDDPLRGDGTPQCLAPLLATLALDLPIQVGPSVERVRVEQRAALIPADDKTAFALVREPPNAPSDGFFPSATVAGGVAGVVLGAGVGVLVALTEVDQRIPHAVTTGVGAGVGMSLFLGGSAAAVGWFAADAGSLKRADADTETHKIHEQWIAKRKALGL